MRVFAQEDVSKSSSPEPTPQPIVAKALTDPVYAFCHLIPFCHLLNGSANHLDHILEGIIKSSSVRHRLALFRQHWKCRKRNTDPIGGM